MADRYKLIRRHTGQGKTLPGDTNILEHAVNGMWRDNMADTGYDATLLLDIAAYNAVQRQSYCIWHRNAK